MTQQISMCACVCARAHMCVDLERERRKTNMKCEQLLVLGGLNPRFSPPENSAVRHSFLLPFSGVCVLGGEEVTLGLPCLSSLGRWLVPMAVTLTLGCGVVGHFCPQRWPWWQSWRSWESAFDILLLEPEGRLHLAPSSCWL